MSKEQEQKEIYDLITKACEPIFHWTIKDGKPKPPSSNILPNCVKERIRHYQSYMNYGNMTLLGAMKFILAYNEEKDKQEFKKDWVGWLPASDKFKKWRDNPFSDVESVIAVALIYATVPEEVKDD